MQINSLKVFTDVARHRSFSRAAQSNGITQSAVSQVVSQMEKKLGLQLVDRSSRPLHLTDAGERFRHGCEDLVTRYEKLLTDVAEAPPTVGTEVGIAAIYSVGLRDMNRFVERFRELEPGATVNIDYDHPDRVYEKVTGGAAEIGLVSFARGSRDLTSLAWRDEPMVVVCSPAHPFSELPCIAPSILSGQSYVAFQKGLVIRREIDRFLRGHDVDVDISIEFDNIENIKKAVEADGGIALLPEPTLRPEVSMGVLVALPLDGCEFVRPMSIIHRKHRVSAATRRCIDALMEPEEKPAVAGQPAAAG